MNVSSNNKNIYIVDDKSVCRGFKTLLTAYDFKVKTFNSANNLNSPGRYGIVFSKNYSPISKQASKQAVLPKYINKFITSDPSSYRQRKFASMPLTNSTKTVDILHPLVQVKIKEN